MKNEEKKRKSNSFEGIVSEELNELSGTTRAAETNPDEMSTGHLGSEDFLYSTPFNEKANSITKNVDSDLVENLIFTP